MLRGLYTAASGMAAQLSAQEVISNNLANASTTGYKKDVQVNNAFYNMVISRAGDYVDPEGGTVIGTLGTGVKPDGVYTDYSNGALQFTGNNLDVSLSGPGFFVVQTPAGERYTRDGNFSVNGQGDLVTKDGYAVLGKGGPVNVGGGKVQFNEDGSVAVDGTVVNQLTIVDSSNPQAFTKMGQNLYALRNGATANDAVSARVMPGYTEASNVNPVSEMVNMLSGLRVYEASQKAVLAQDETLGQLISDVARAV